MLERLFETVGSLGGPGAYLAVAALAAGESSLGVGLVVPGETGMIIGGVIVSQGNATFGLMWLVAVVGAIVGDSVGYEIGRRFGPRIRRTRVGRAVGDERWERAEVYLAQRGGRAVFVGRFVAVVRSLVPAVAGITRMPYSRFLAFNAAGAVLWATLYVTLGYAAGRSYKRVADAAEGAGYVLLGVVAVIVVIAAAARWAANHQERVQSVGRRIAAFPPATLLRRYFRGPMRFVRGRFRIDDAFGLSLTLGFLALIASAWALYAVASGVAERSDFVDVDLTVTRTLAEHRVDWMTDAARWVTDLGSMALLGPLVAVAALAWLVRTGRWGVAMFLAVAIVGAAVANELVKDLIERARPPARFHADGADGFAFPSGHTAQAVVTYGALAYLLGSVIRSWPGRVVIWTLAVLVSLVVGFTRIYLGVHWMSDVLAGLALGTAWLAFVITAFGTSTRLHRRHIDRAMGQTASVTSRTA